MNKNTIFSLQTELDEVARVWNTHYLQSKIAKEGKIRGRPLNAYLVRNCFMLKIYIRPIDCEVLELCKYECTSENALPYDEVILELGCIFMD